MRIGRLEFGIIRFYHSKPKYRVFINKPICGCYILEFGIFYITWTDRECKCQACKKYTCECEDYDASS